MDFDSEGGVSAKKLESWFRKIKGKPNFLKKEHFGPDEVECLRKVVDSGLLSRNLHLSTPSYMRAEEHVYKNIKEIIKRNKLFWKKPEYDFYDANKTTFPKITEYVQLNSDDAEYASLALRLFADVMPSRGYADDFFPRALTSAVSLLFALNAEVCFRALHLYTLILVSSQSFPEIKKFWKMLPTLLQTIPCGNGSSTTNDAVNFRDYVDGKVTLEDAKKLFKVKIPQFADAQHPIKDHITAAQFRFRASLEDSNERMYLLALQAATMTAFTFTRISTLAGRISECSPHGVYNLVKLYTSPLPEDEALLKFHNNLRPLLLESLQVMISETRSELPKMLRVFRLKEILTHLMDPRLSIHHLNRILNLFQLYWRLAPMPHFGVTIQSPFYNVLAEATSVKELSLEAKVAVVIFAENELMKTRMDGHLYNINEFNILFFLDGLSQDLDVTFDLIKAKNNDKLKLMRKLLFHRTRCLIRCLDLDTNGFHLAADQSPFLSEQIIVALAMSSFRASINNESVFQWLTKIGNACDTLLADDNSIDDVFMDQVSNEDHKTMLKIDKEAASEKFFDIL